MELGFLWLPTRDLVASVRFYRDVLGWEEAWREGDTTVAFRMPGSDVQLMVDLDREGLTAGPFFRVDSVDRFFAENRSRLHFVLPPRDIPPGRYACFVDPSGNTLHLYDTTKEA